MTEVISYRWQIIADEIKSGRQRLCFGWRDEGGSRWWLEPRGKSVRGGAADKIIRALDLTPHGIADNQKGVPSIWEYRNAKISFHPRVAEASEGNGASG
jgi:hypothetical protein